MPFLYDLPTPCSINFPHFLTDPTGARTGQLSSANASRAAMRSSLKECNQTSGEPDWYKAIKLIEEYLPQLLGLMKAIEVDILLMPNELTFSWRSTLSSRRVPTAPRISLSSFQYELACVLLSLAFSISNAAHSRAASIGLYELGTETDRRSGDEKLTAAADALCRASGLFEFLSHQIIPPWEQKHSDGVSVLRSTRPPELSREATSGLAQLTLADAEQLAIRRLLSRSAMDRHTNPGAGLPKSHPSPALLAKLHLNVHNLYSGSRDAFKLATGFTEIAGSIRDYVVDESQLALGRAYKWLAVDAGDQAGHHAEAIGWLLLARETLKNSSGRSVVVMRNGSIRNDRARRKVKFDRELEEISRFYKIYEQLNRTVTFEPIPPSTTLLARVPGGRTALNVRAYSLPTPLLKDFRTDTGSGTVELPDSDDEAFGTTVSKDPKYALRDTYY